MGSGAQPRRVAGASRRCRLGVPDVAARVVRPVAARRVRGDRRRRAGERRCAGTARRSRHAPRRADNAGARLRGPEAPAHQTHRHRGADLVPALQRAWRGIRSGRAHHPRGARRRRLDRHRTEGLEHGRRTRGVRSAAGAHRLGRPEAPWHHLLRDPDAAAGHRGPTAASDERARVVQRGLPRQRPGAGGQRDRRGERRLEGRPDDAGARATPRPVTPSLPGPARDRPRLAGGDRRACRRHGAAQVVSATGWPDGSRHRAGRGRRQARPTPSCARRS